MTTHNRPARLNRGLLAVTGLVLAAAGAFALATHFRVLRVLDPGTTLVPGTQPPPTWVLYAVAAGAVVLGLLALRWLVAQLARAPKTHTWHLEADPGTGRTELPAKTAVEPLLAEVGAYPGVHAAHGTLTGTRANPAVVLRVTVEQDGDPADIRHRIETEGLPRLRQALDLDELPAGIEFRFSTSTGARAL
ncbi:Asp23/Gls24 family envelope stress response protein [Actinokineospora bangkokensis]|uniref:Alkaline shock response membrane anchor protein AmaP n=1 Tax=Actinokineospora bangkokensis TaxID=1193682 RepID=A0A1Q9LIL3_9PSEU|nr:hypothetical protein [Actinokineospora bangkokensis]OLR91835.1 hypothetical protein BJP25_23640 [Actinokineospora bangkokensis]